MNSIFINRKSSIVFITILSCLSQSRLFAQEKRFLIYVQDVKHNKIQYSIIKSLHDNNYFITDSNGVFEKKLNIYDTLIVSNLGYNTSTFQIKNAKNIDTIYLTEKGENLGEVIVGNFETVKAGILKEKQQRSFSGDNTSSIFEMTTLVKIKEIAKKIRISKIYLKQKNFNTTSPIALHIYSVGNNGLPERDLLDKQVIISHEMHKKGLITIDVKDKNIYLNATDFFVGIQFLTPYNAIQKSSIDDGIAETTTLRDSLTYRRSLKLNNRWYIEFTNGIFIPKQNNFDEKSYTFNEKVKENNPINMIAEVEVEILEK